MKSTGLFVLAVLVISSSMPVFAAEKDECLLASKNCNDEVDSIQQKIQRLNTEIKKGHRVYTSAELNKLQAKLKDVNDLLDDLNRPGH
jgi:septal ring factor EnvC (AmiA/AmiB activator)